MYLLSSCAFVVRASCAEFWFQFVVVVGACHLLFCCCRFVLSFVVCGCDSHLFVYDISGCQHCLLLCALVCVCVLQADSNHISVLDPCHYFCNHFHCCVVCWNGVWMRVSVLQLFFQGSFFLST